MYDALKYLPKKTIECTTLFMTSNSNTISPKTLGDTAV